ncbi:MAG: hypothetical protein ACJ71Z_13750 [Aeromicrobium sp.]
MRTPVYVLALAAAVLAGCGNSAPPVDWGGKYSTTVQVRLDKLIDAKDCASLRAELATAKSIDAAERRSYGSGSQDLVAYIKWGMDNAGCKDVD